MATPKLSRGPGGQHPEDCECATCELGGGCAEIGRQRAIDWDKPAIVARDERRFGPRVARTEEWLRKMKAAQQNAAPPPAGGFREFLKHKGGKNGRR